MVRCRVATWCGAGWRHGAVQGGDMVRCRVATWCGVVTYSSISRLKFMKKLDPVHQQGKGSGLRALAPHPPRAHTHRHTRTHTHTSLHVHTRTGTLPTTEFRPATHYVTVNKWYHVHHTVPCATYGTICTIRYHVHHTVPCAPYGTMCTIWYHVHAVVIIRGPTMPWPRPSSPTHSPCYSHDQAADADEQDGAEGHHQDEPPGPGATTTGGL